MTKEEMRNIRIAQLVNYGVSRNLIEREDRYWALNNILAVLGLDSFESPEELLFDPPLEEIGRAHV